MVNKKLKQFAINNGYDIKDGQVQGQYKGMWFSIRDFFKSRLYVFSFYIKNVTLFSELTNALNDVKEDLLIKKFEVLKSGIILKTKTHNNSEEEQIELLLKQVYDTIDFFSLSNTNLCNICGSTANLNITRGNVPMKVCNTCYDTIHSEYKIIREVPRKKYILGFIGSLIGAILFSLPWLIFANFTLIYYAFASILIGIGSALGYMLFRGARKRKFAFFSVIISNAIVSLIVPLIGMIKQAFFEIGFIKADMIGFFMSNNIYAPKMLANIIISIIVSIIGSLLLSKYLRKFTISLKLRKI